MKPYDPTLLQIFAAEQAEQFAGRLVKEGKDDHARLNRDYELCFARPPDSHEFCAGEEFLAAVRERLHVEGMPAEQIELESWRALVRVLFRLNEFVYVD